ncbi:HET-domain-containing protein [Pseudovirgaria hyperparasitica]|uniref:HET-domain-containing protein n=1 Tax=Pseudovirgaria hyperparasitica TaxID=470096 RepID=A0A6A6W3X9_9PEZI|nr:HET-domain-containing protein [Pseudovirgaria hyperparasitica]KAF2757638.1 HET-domain-containing protein [Pseudovirgaria hyperparasitica]
MEEFPHDPTLCNEEESVLTFHSDDRLCIYCSKAIEGIIEPNEEPWEITMGAFDQLRHPNRRAAGPAIGYLHIHHDGTVRTLRHERHKCPMCFVVEGYLSLKIKMGGPQWSLINDGHYRIVFQQHLNKLEIALEIRIDAPPPPSDRMTDWRFKTFIYDLYVLEEPNDPFWESDGGFQIRPKNVDRPCFHTRFNTHPSSDATFNEVKVWLQQCKDQKLHPRCQWKMQELPKRIIYLGIETPPEWVYLHDGCGRIEEYVTLSYSWGSSPPFRTTCDNITSHFNGIATSTLPKTLKDAVLIASRLGFRYIWIDALCIVQDDKDDWAEHGPVMAQIYSNSALTISATGSADCESGIFTDLMKYGTEIGSFRHRSDVKYRRSVFFDQRRDFGGPAGHLFTRGWTFQEHLVSPRVLHYTGSGVTWECFSIFHRQGSPENLFRVNTSTESEWATQNALYKRIAEPQSQHTFENYVNRMEAYHKWHKWVVDFSSRDLTHVNDKLPAMAGIAAHFSTNMQSTYLAGLWKENFVSDLLWERRSLQLQHHTGIAPSWSWASVSGWLDYHFDSFEYVLTGSRYDIAISSVDVQESVTGSFGRVTDARIITHGWLQEVKLVRLTFLRKRNEHSAEHGFVERTDVACKLDHLEDVSMEPIWCWALRIGLFVPTGLRSPNDARIAMLLLDRVGPPQDNTFKRIGLAYTVSWYDDRGPPLPEDICVSGSWQKMVLI